MDEKAQLLAELRDVHVPSASPWPAPGWWWLALAVILLAGLLWLGLRRYRLNRWRREARQELADIQSAMPGAPVDKTLSRASRLVRRVLLAVAPAEQVAALQGADLLATLDGLCRQPVFTQGAGQLLETGPYQRSPAATPADLDDLFDAIGLLIQKAPHG